MFFFIAGLSTKTKEIGRFHTFICPCCGQLTHLIIYKSYDYFHLFFIPIFRWNVSYSAQSACCGTWFSLSFERGKVYEKNPDTILSPQDFTPMNQSFRSSPQCPSCKRTIKGEYRYCPYCGKPL